MDARIRAAGAAFASLRRQFFGSKLVPGGVKAAAYEGLVLNILMYGSEAWALTKALETRLERFHAGCVRAMCRVTRWQTWHHRIPQADLEARLGVQPISGMLRTRQLRWAGHVARMDFSRLPRRLLSCWVRRNRPRGRPQTSCCHQILGLVRSLDLGDACCWGAAAQDRSSWRSLICTSTT